MEEKIEVSVLCRWNGCNCRGYWSPASLLPPLLYWLSLVFICFCAELFANSAGSCLPLLFFFSHSFVSFIFSPPGYFSASWAHWNWLCAGSDKHWNQHKKGQKRVDCRKDVISFIRLSLDLVAWNNSMVVNEYGWGDGFIPKASWSMSKMVKKCNFPALWSQTK